MRKTYLGRWLLRIAPLLILLIPLAFGGFTCSRDTGENIEKPPSEEYPKSPVLMVHGLNGSSSNFNKIKQGLIEHGYPSTWLYAIDLVPDNSTCDPGHVEQIHTMVEKIVQETGFQRIDLLGHSNGGMDNMNYMRYNNGTQRVRNWVSIGGANNFTCEGAFGQLAPSDPTPGDNVLYTSIYSTTDNLVPTNVSILKGSRNLSVSGVSHINLLFDTNVFQFILEALQGKGLNNNNN